jgi:hypothetical protein
VKYILTLLLIFLASTSLLADSGIECSPQTISALSSNEQDFIVSNKEILRELGIEDLIHWAATTAQVKQAPCRKKVPTEKEILSYLNSVGAKDSKKSIKHRGVQFEDESPQLIETFKRLTGEYDYLDEEKKNQVNIQEKYEINPRCRKVICAAKLVFGDKLGPKLLFLGKKYGLNGSQLSFDNTSKLNVSEVDRLIVTVQDFPESTFPLVKNKQYTKFKRGFVMSSSSPGVVANSTITFFDSWVGLESNEMMEYTAFHELAHYTGQELGLDDDSRWLALSGWTEKDGDWSSSKKDTFVSKYAKQSPFEDFAEAVAAYRYNPNLLKVISPDKYSYIQETVFHGIEYTSKKKCHPRNYYKNRLKGKAAEMLSKFDSVAFLRDKVKLEDSIRLCRDESLEFIFINSEETIKLLDGCISNSIDLSMGAELLESITPALKYRDLVYGKQTKFPKKTGNPVAKGADKVHLEARLLIKDIIVNDFHKWDQRYYFMYPAKDAKSLCESMTANSHQSLKGIDDLFNDGLLAYKNSERVNEILYKTCIDAQGSTPSPMSKEAISSSFPVRAYTKNEFDKNSTVKLSSLIKQKKNLVDALANNGIVFKTMYYLEYQERIQELDKKLEKVKLQIEKFNSK